MKDWSENKSKPFLRIPSLISKDQKENKVCTMDDVRGDVLVPPRGTALEIVTASSFRLCLHETCHEISM